MIPTSRSNISHLVILIISSYLARIVRTAPTTSMPPASSDLLSEFEHSLALQDDPVKTLHYHFEKQMEPYLQLHKFDSSTFRGNTVTCNDGSPTGYYKRLNNQSKSWIIYLQGGGFCGSEEACQQRWRHSPHLMSSNFWPKSKSFEGILSSEPKDNPFLWNANHIYVPYCSSDSWTGRQPGRGSTGSSSSFQHSAHQFESADSESYEHQSTMFRDSSRHHHNHRHSFAFMGSTILERVFESLFEDLPRDSSLYEGKFILLAGDSAGATGVILNLDKLNKFVQLKFSSVSQQSNCNTGLTESNSNNNNCHSAEVKPAPVFRGLADSGWFLDNEPYDYGENPSLNNQAPTPSSMISMSHRYLSPNSYNNQDQHYANEENQQRDLIDCDRQRCSPSQAIRQAMLFWNGKVPSSCAKQHSTEPWRCYFGYRAYQTLKTPLFVVQWLYDEAQLVVDNIGRPDTVSQWNYVNKLVNDMRSSLENVTALFAPSCFSHSLIIKQNWNQININGFKLPHILNSWEEETLANQPTIEALLAQTPVKLNLSVASVNQHQQLDTGPQTNPSNSQQLVTPSFTFRNSNQQQQPLTSLDPSHPKPSVGRSSRPRKRKRNNHNQQQKLTSNASNQSNRLSRSASSMILESDQTTSQAVLNNNVPHLLTATTNRLQQENSGEKFRLIDSCGWPQCNRDCPILDQEIMF